MIMINFINMAVADINLLIENILSYKNGVFVFYGSTGNRKTCSLNKVLKRVIQQENFCMRSL